MRVKLLYVPRAHQGVYGPPVSRIPLLALPVLKSILEKRGIHTDIDDLDIKVDSRLRQGKEYNLDLLLDVPRIKKHITGKQDPELEALAESLIKLTDTKGYDLFGFTIADEWNISAQTGILLLTKHIIENTGAYTAIGGADIYCIKNSFSIEEIMKATDFISFEPPQVSPWRLLEVIEVLGGNTAKPRDPYITSKDVMVDNFGRNTQPFHLSKRLQHIMPYLSAHPEFQEDRKFIDCITTPDFSGLPLDLYRTIPHDIAENFNLKKGILVLPYMFTVNCPFNCIFCGRSADNNTFQCKTPEEIADDLELFKKRYKATHFRFINDNINPTKSFSMGLIKELKQRDLDVKIFDMANLFNLDREILTGFSEVGVRGLSYGLETANEDLLTYVQKQASFAYAKKMLRIAHDLGMWNEIQLLCGLPFERDHHVENTLAFMKEWDGIVNFYLVHKFKLFHSKLFNDPEAYKITNVREPPQDDVYGWAFDEIGGLAWDQKYEQIKLSTSRISRLAQSLSQRINYSSTKDISVIRLHLLYDILGNKQDIIDYLQGKPFQWRKKRGSLLQRVMSRL